MTPLYKCHAFFHKLDIITLPLMITYFQVDDQFIAAGMVDGMIAIRQKEDESRNLLHCNKLSYRHEGEITHCSKVDTYVNERTKKNTAKHDLCLKKFQYSKALDQVMVNYIANKCPHITMGLLQELIRRKCLVQSLNGRDEKYILNILKFTIRHVGNVRYCRVMLHLADVLLGMYLQL